MMYSPPLTAEHRPADESVFQTSDSNARGTVLTHPRDDRGVRPLWSADTERPDNVDAELGRPRSCRSTPQNVGQRGACSSQSENNVYDDENVTHDDEVVLHSEDVQETIFEK